MMRRQMSPERRRVRTNTIVTLVVFWALIIPAILIVGLLHNPKGWFLFAAACGWTAASVVRSLLDAYYLTEGQHDPL